MKSFDSIYKTALRKHGEAELTARLPKARSPRGLASLGDDRYLSTMSKCIFQAGFVWKVVENMWPGFEDAFLAFDPESLCALKQKQRDALKQDERIIRNPQKIRSVFDNASFVAHLSAEHGGFGKFLAQWPTDDIAGLWEKLSKEGSRLGGITGPRFLRSVGKDTYIFSPDVVKALITAGVIDKPPSGKKALAACHEAFAQWKKESGRSFGELSVVAACSV